MAHRQFIFLLPFLFLYSSTSTADKWHDQRGNHYSFEHNFYHFVNDAGQGISLWLPPTDRPIRGAIIFGNPGGGFGGDTRNKTRQRDVLEFAARHQFGVAGVTGFPGSKTYNELAAIFIDTFTAWSAYGKHPELAQLPFIFSGGSNAGIFSFAMMAYVPERTIAITPNVGPIYTGNITQAVKKVPAWMHVGVLDPLLPNGIADTEALFAEHGEYSLWAWDAEHKGHENGSSDYCDIAYWDTLIPLRLPEGTQSNSLRSLDMREGWWVDHSSWDHSITAIAPYTTQKSYRSQPGRYGWVPTEGLAKLYQSVATRQRPLTLQRIDKQNSTEGDTEGVFLSSTEVQVVRPGEVISLQISVPELVRGVKRIDIYDQTERLGSIEVDVKGPIESIFRFQVDGQKRVYALHARAIGTGLGATEGVVRLSKPLQFVVSDPVLSTQISKQLLATRFDQRLTTQTRVDADHSRLKSRLTKDRSLVAAALTTQQERQLQAPDKPAQLWRQIQNTIPSAVIHEPVSQGIELRQTQASGMSANAGYGEKGLYLYFEVTDAMFSAYDNNHSGGGIDLHLASLSLPYLNKQTASARIYSYPRAYSLLNNAVQIQFNAHDKDGPDLAVSINHWDHWSWQRYQTTKGQIGKATGLQLAAYQLNHDRRAFELFLPWRLVGNPGITGKPPPGSALVTVISYTSRAKGQKWSWPLGTHPWAIPAKGDENIYGQIYLQ